MNPTTGVDPLFSFGTPSDHYILKHPNDLGYDCALAGADNDRWQANLERAWRVGHSLRSKHINPLVLRAPYKGIPSNGTNDDGNINEFFSILYRSVCPQ